MRSRQKPEQFFEFCPPVLGELRANDVKLTMIKLSGWRSLVGVLTAAATITIAIPEGRAGDWPMWRYDSARGASTPEELPSSLRPLWSRDLRPARPAWPDTQEKLQFDSVPQPIVLEGRLFVPSTVNDSVSAYDAKSGKLQWRFFADGPVRFAPAGAEGRLYFVSDDGHLYCVDAATGKLHWKVNGGPAERLVIGNHRLVSSWPARGGPVVHEGKVYFSASIWPFMGIFIHAVDGKSGEIVWTNSGDGTNYTVQPHGAPSFAAVVPQGHLVVSGNNLVVPGGRSTPAVFDLATGKLKHFLFDKKNGGHHVMGGGDLYFVANGAYGMADGKRVSNEYPRLSDGKTLIFEEKGAIHGRGFVAEVITKKSKDKKGKEVVSREYVRESHFSIKVDGPSKIHLKAGAQIFAAGGGMVAAYQTTKEGGTQKPKWSAKIEGVVHHMLAADEKLFVVTDQPRIYCFGIGGEGNAPLQHAVPSVEALQSPEGRDRYSPVVKELARDPEVGNGFAVALGVSSGNLIAATLAESALHLVVLERSADKVDLLRRRCDEAGIYGDRMAARVGDVASTSLPPYLASLLVCEDLDAAGFEKGDARFLANTFKCLRPYGGTAAIFSSEEQHAALLALLAESSLREQAVMTRKEGVTYLRRPGALPETDDWTHQYGNSAQTGISGDKVVKAPLGLLWFGGPTHEGILPRHGHGPSPQVAGGRLFIEGPDMLRAVDVYTGRVLWEKEMKKFGKFYNTTSHFSGAGEIGSNYVSLTDRLYAVHGKQLVELDAVTGATLKTFTLGDAPKGEKRDPYWGYIGAQGDYLIVTSAPVEVKVLKGKVKQALQPKAKGRQNFWDMLEENQFASGSRRLVVFNRHSGDLLWQRDAVMNFRHNNITVSEGVLFCTDALSEGKISKASADVKAQLQPTLYALDLKTGNEIWKTSENVFGTFFNYSAEHDILLQAGSKFRDRAKDEVGKGMIAYRGATGDVIWEDHKLEYGGPCLLWHDRIITNGTGGFSLDLLTGKKTGWSYQRMYGCNTAIGSDKLLTFRSGAAGFYDLEGDSGTGNIGGFRSSCTNNLIVANGVLNAPDYTRTCSCAYQNQTSLALVHMPDAEFWTFGATHVAGRIGINFGAPGDRRDPNGTLWTEFPSVGGPSDEIEVGLSPAQPDIFRLHSSTFQGEGLKWVAASGIIGAQNISIPVGMDGPWRVRLYFAEPEEVNPGERIINVRSQNETVLTGIDIVEEAGGRSRLLTKEFEAVAKGGKIVIELSSEGALPTVLSGVELVLK